MKPAIATLDPKLIRHRGIAMSAQILLRAVKAIFARNKTPPARPRLQPALSGFPTPHQAKLLSNRS
jgi:hypothetical protein